MSDLSNIPWGEFPRRAAPDDLVAPHFKFHELTKSEQASRLGIDNTFAAAREARAAVFLCRNVLEPVRERFGSFSPNSVFRCQDLERALKKKRSDWVSKSQHTLGQACDIEVPGLPNVELAQWVIDNLEFDQVILECYNPKEGVNSGWVHVSRLPPEQGTNRRQVLSYVWNRREGGYVYVEGLHEAA
ncbi:MAG: D-Ala-D-Ala carboxypeptidase family metallohydrolase [Pseudomonadota bacterium]